MKNKLTEFRVLAGLTQAKLAQKAGISMRTVQATEAYIIEDPRLSTARSLCAVLSKALKRKVRVDDVWPIE